ncbi:hypothetical protein [Pseudomonas chlororaphis]|uniref:Uncharacterized protein n=1 Tax=Pseudomonas chlororaphis subsp. aurantiaca TaxID=86192 RepID=A0AAJ1E5J0_9PSED|nr:hypothetical protein [Pseudomonas chlororaphis]MBU4637208.1 hypothetical protein [Pseudomonas chlororaphis subsp. aurantiaca]
MAEDSISRGRGLSLARLFWAKVNLVDCMHTLALVLINKKPAMNDFAGKDILVCGGKLFTSLARSEIE